MWIWLLAALGCARPNCAAVQALPDNQSVLAVGDSALAWHAPRCQSVPDYLALELGEAVTNAAVNGAQMTAGFTIPAQYREGDWRWVVISGGGNDLNEQCACGTGDCERVLDRLADPDDWSGVTPKLAERALADGARVLLVGYYEFADAAWYGLGECGQELEVLRSRYADYAAQTEGVLYIDGGEVVDWRKNRADYDFDGVHLAPSGAAALGQLLAERMATQKRR